MQSLRPVVRIYFFMREGCSYCAEAEPYLQALRSRHPTSLLVVPLNVDRRAWEVLGWAPKRGDAYLTPAYAMVIGNELVKTRIGAMNTKQLETWIGKDNL